jgi:signal transduction histidine kinase
VLGLRRALAGIALLGLVTGVTALVFTVTSDHVPHAWVTGILGALVGWSFIGTGLFAWLRRPESRFGALMVLVGFLWFVGALNAADSPLAFTIGVVGSSVYIAALIHMLLTYPSGQLRSRGERRLVSGTYVLSILAMLPLALLGGDDEFDCECPDLLTKVAEDDGVLRVLDGLTTVIAVSVVAAVLVALARRWRTATGPQRRAMAPVLWSGAALLGLLAASLATYTVGVASLVTDLLGYAGLVAFASIPWAFLLGLLRSRVARSGAVTDLLMRITGAPGTGGLREWLADALGDRSLDLVYWLEDGERWVDQEGRTIEPPPAGGPRAWTPVELEGRRVGAIVYDRSLLDNPELVGSVAAAAGLAVQHERLNAELRAKVQELRASRARLVEVGTAERRRLERNLHDGAQQRLVALSLTLRIAQGRVHTDPERANELLSAAQEELSLALEELRELARGIHPAVLSDRGLDAALEGLAGRSPVPVEVDAMPDERLPAPVEAAAYFVVAEALTNVVKYANASQAHVSVERRNGHAFVEVRDDGVGGADPQRVSGLRGLADRVAALDGRLQLESPPGEGTRLRARIPV